MLYQVAVGGPDLACEDCGCKVDGSERGRAAHRKWHERQQVIDLTEQQEHARDAG